MGKQPSRLDVGTENLQIMARALQEERYWQFRKAGFSDQFKSRPTHCTRTNLMVTHETPITLAWRIIIVVTINVHSFFHTLILSMSSYYRLLFSR
jgi:hypothetical protein